MLKHFQGKFCFSTHTDREQEQTHSDSTYKIIAHIILVVELFEGGPSDCPMTTVRKGRTYQATVAKGEAINLQGDLTLSLKSKKDVPRELT